MRALVARWVRGCEDQRSLAPSSVAVQSAHLSAYLSAAVDDGVLATSPWRTIRLPPIERDDVVPLTPDEVAAMTHALPERLALLVPLGVA